MSDNVENLGIRLSADGVPELTNGMALAGAATENTGRKLDVTGKALGAANAQLNQTGASAKQVAAAWRLLPAQITDVATSLASGSPAWLVAIQQGGQIKDSFGGVIPTMRALSSAFTVARIGAGVFGATVGVAIASVARVQGELSAYSRALIMSGNAAGTTALQLDSMARAIGRTGTTVHEAAQALAALAGTGEVAKENLQAFAKTTVDAERTVGIPVDDMVRRFAELGREPLQASLRLNQGMNYLTAATYEQIRALMAQGKVAEAGATAQRAYATAMSTNVGQVRENLGFLEVAWNAVGRAAKGTWDKMLGLGRRQDLDGQIKALEDELKRLAALRQGKGFSGGFQEAKEGSGYSQAEIDVRKQLDALRKLQTDGKKTAEQIASEKAALLATQRAQNEADIARDLATSSAAAAARQALIDRDLASTQAAGSRRTALVEQELATLESLRDREVVGIADYYDRRTVIEQRGIAVEINNVQAQLAAERARTAARVKQIDEEISAERRRKPESGAETTQQEARLIALAGQRTETITQGRTKEIELNAQLLTSVQKLTDAEVQNSRAAERETNARQEATAGEIERARQALAQLNEQQRQANLATAADLIADPYTRAAARARLDIQELRRFYDEQTRGLNAQLKGGLADRDPDQAEAVRQQILRAEQQKNDAIVLRQRQLTEELKPEWQKQLDAWQDHTRLMRESFDEFQSGWIDSGRSAWQTFLRTGKGSLDALAQYARNQVGDQIFKQAIAGPFSKIGQGFAGWLGLGGKAADVTGQAAEVSTRSLNTAALTANTTSLGTLAIAANTAAAALSAVAASGGNSTAGLLGQLLGSFASGGSGFTAVDPGGYGMTPGDGSVVLPTRGGKASGGSVGRGGLYEVNERGPELLTVNNRTYLMMGGRDGYVTPNGGRGGSGGNGQAPGVSITFAPQISIDARTDRSQVLGIVDQAMRVSEARLMDKMGRGMA